MGVREAALLLSLLLAPPDAVAREDARPSLTGQARTLEFQGGLGFGTPLEDFEVPASLLLQVRYFPKQRWLYCSGFAIGDLHFDLTNPEDGHLMPLLHVGAGVGLRADLGARLSLYGGADLSLSMAWDWPTGRGQRGFVAGGRIGPTGGMTLWLGRVFGHPMGLEARAAFSPMWLDGRWHSAAAFGLLITSVLLPEP